MSVWLLQAANRDRSATSIPVETLLRELGERSFGWSVLLFALINLLPLPPGSTLITGIPLMLLAAQMTLGFHHVRLPGFIRRRHINRTGLRQGIIWLKPIMRRIEKIIHPRHEWVFRHDRTVGALLFCIAFAIFVPVPLNSWFSAFTALITAIGMVERDGLVTLIGLGLGMLSVLLTAAVIVSLLLGVDTLF